MNEFKSLAVDSSRGVLLYHAGGMGNGVPRGDESIEMPWPRLYDEAKYLYPYHFYERSPSYLHVDPASKPGSVGDAGLEQVRIKRNGPERGVFAGGLTHATARLSAVQ